MGLFIFNSKDCLEDSFSTFHKSGQVHRKITSEQLAGCRGKPASSSELAGSQYLELPIPTLAPQGDVWPWDHGQHRRDPGNLVHRWHCVSSTWLDLVRDFPAFDANSRLFSSVQLLSRFQLWPHGLQHTRLPWPSPPPGVSQTHVHWVSDAIQPSHPLSSSSPAFNPSQQEGLF